MSRLLLLLGLATLGCTFDVVGVDEDAGVPVDAGSADAGAVDAGDADPLCVACVSDDDCGTGVCVQLGSDSFCKAKCSSKADCGATEDCLPESTVAGVQQAVCLAPSAVCGPSPIEPEDAGVAPRQCGTLVAPDVASSCTACSRPGTGTCRLNGCWGTWWCNVAVNRCQAPPVTCAPPVTLDGGTADPGDAGAVPVTLDAGPEVTSDIGVDGGTASRLYFAVVGDTRPAIIDAPIAEYPGIIHAIYAEIAAMRPMPTFVVSPGDYIFARKNGSQGDPQFAKYLAARDRYPGLLFPALGNHECTGATASNCGPGTADGVTRNYTSFLRLMLGPIQKTLPWYEIPIDAPDASWTSKFVFVAPNAWTTAQAEWLEAALTRPTTYTFIVRHEPSAASTAPGVTPSDAIIDRHPYTLRIVGHTHTYSHKTAREVVIGNGGAPLTGNKNYGFGVFLQRPDGAIVVDMIDVSTGAPDPAFHFAIRADGTLTP